jgi:hypothetical protein
MPAPAGAPGHVYLAWSNIAYQTEAHLLARGQQLPVETRILLARLRDFATAMGEEARQALAEAPAAVKRAPARASAMLGACYRAVRGVLLAAMLLVAWEVADRMAAPSAGLPDALPDALPAMLPDALPAMVPDPLPAMLPDVQPWPRAGLTPDPEPETGTAPAAVPASAPTPPSGRRTAGARRAAPEAPDRPALEAVRAAAPEAGPADLAAGPAAADLAAVPAAADLAAVPVAAVLYLHLQGEANPLYAVAAEEALALDRRDRIELQTRLRLAGYDPKGIDGVFGPLTRRAIAAWQARHGIAVTAHLSRETRDRLEAETDHAFAALAREQRRIRRMARAPRAAPRPAVAEAAECPAGHDGRAMYDVSFWCDLVALKEAIGGATRDPALPPPVPRTGTPRRD